MEYAVTATSQGFRQLFNGRDLSRWEHVGPGGFVVEDGLLKTQSGMGLLWYSGETSRATGTAPLSTGASP